MVRPARRWRHRGNWGLLFTLYTVEEAVDEGSGSGVSARAGSNLQKVRVTCLVSQHQVGQSNIAKSTIWGGCLYFQRRV